ncbi:MAG: 16S rRNA (uracil(1498)-N(3))-methyltransferase [Cellvibrionaceae bacterium]
MNLVLLSQQDFIDKNQVSMSGRRLDHIQAVHQATIGDQLTVGMVNGKIGKGTILSINDQKVVMSIDLNQAPPPPLPITLVLALPRPKMLKRILQTCATMGVKKIILINSYRVEKSFWLTPLLKEASIEEQFTLGLEQAKDTLMPELIIEKRFKPFVQDRLPGVCENTLAVVAHPGSQRPYPTRIEEPTTLVVGPEGGFIPYEIALLTEAGCEAVHLGPRILRVETAITALLAHFSS